MEIRSKDIRLVNLSSIKLDPKNRNKHPKEQIESLAKIIQYQGFRDPIIISNQTGYVKAGEGRYLAAKKLGMQQIPAIFQDFDSEDQEYAFGVSHNAIAAWADLDLSNINIDIPDLGPDFDIDLLGIENFKIDSSEKLNPELINLNPQWIVAVQCNSEEEMENLFKEFNERGMSCKLIT